VSCEQNPFQLGCPPVVTPPPSATPSPCAASEQLVDFDELYQAVRGDLARLDADDAIFSRYLTIANRFTAGSCATALDVDRQAITKLVNMLSIDARMTAPVAIDAQELIYRIDLRDYSFDRSIAVNGQLFADAWEAIAASNPYAVPFVGDDADAARLASGTDVPVMFADSVLDTATVGNLYYALIDIDVRQSVDDFISSQLGIDQEQDLLDEFEIRAVTTQSGVSTTDLLVQRNDIQVRAGMLWQEFEVPRSASSGTIDSDLFEDPFALRSDPRALIYTLPNGLLAFAVADEHGAFLEQDENLLDVLHGNARALNAVSCSSCHSAGLFPVNDEARPLLLQNAREVGLNRDEIEQLEAVYLDSGELARVTADDSNAFYLRALQLLGLPLTGPDPVGSVADRFEADVALADVAGDLGVTPEDLRLNLDLLDPTLERVRSGVLDRDAFTEVYVESLCVLSVVLENQPDAAICDAVDSAAALAPIPVAH